MRRFVEASLYFAVTVFILSGWAIATGYIPIWQPLAADVIDTAPPLSPGEILGLLSMPHQYGQMLGDGLLGQLLRPQSPLMWGYMVIAWLAASWIALRFQRMKDPLPDPDRVDPKPKATAQRIWPAPALVIVGLMAAAVWPWLMPRWPIAGYAVAVLMFLAIMGAAELRYAAGVKTGKPRSVSWGILAGWVTVTFSMALASMLDDSLTLDQGEPGLLALVACALITLWVQLRLEWPVVYSATVMLGLAGLALAAVDFSFPLASAAAIALTFVTLSLVRVTT